MQILSTGWAEPPPASSSSPKHRRRPLTYSQTGTHPKFEKSTGRWLKTLHSTTPTKSSHPSASYRTRSSAPCRSEEHTSELQSLPTRRSSDLHPKFEKSTGRWLKTLHSTTPTKSSHPSASYRTRSSAPC